MRAQHPTTIDPANQRWFDKVKLFRRPHHVQSMLQTIFEWNNAPPDLLSAQNFIEEVCVCAWSASKASFKFISISSNLRDTFS